MAPIDYEEDIEDEEEEDDEEEEEEEAPRARKRTKKWKVRLNADIRKLLNVVSLTFASMFSLSGPQEAQTRHERLFPLLPSQPSANQRRAPRS